MKLIAIQFLSVRVPSGAIVTLHSGNTCELDNADACWLLENYGGRVEPALESLVYTDAVVPPPAEMLDQLVRTDAPVTDAPVVENEADRGKGKKKKAA